MTTSKLIETFFGLNFKKSFDKRISYKDVPILKVMFGEKKYILKYSSFVEYQLLSFSKVEGDEAVLEAVDEENTREILNFLFPKTKLILPSIANVLQNEVGSRKFPKDISNIIIDYCDFRF
jgi:hypothetical protein